MNIVAELTLEAIGLAAKSPIDNYSRLLRLAFEDHPPAFSQKWYGDKYRKYAVDPLWLCQSLIDNSAKEGEGAEKLWKLAASSVVPTISEAVRLHAVDEARHSRLYLGMLRVAFPVSLDDENLKQLYDRTPQFTINDHPERRGDFSDLLVLDHLIQMNIGEVRTRVHQLLLMPVIQAHCSSDKRTQARLQGVLKSILDDETRHIRYTAELIEEGMARNRGYVRDLLYHRLQEFNQITLDEVGESSFDDE